MCILAIFIPLDRFWINLIHVLYCISFHVLSHGSIVYEMKTLSNYVLLNRDDNNTLIQCPIESDLSKVKQVDQLKWDIAAICGVI